MAKFLTFKWQFSGGSGHDSELTYGNNKNTMAVVVSAALSVRPEALLVKLVTVVTVTVVLVIVTFVHWGVGRIAGPCWLK